MESMTFREFTDQMVALYYQDKKEEALRLVEQNQSSFPEQAARLTFWRMCFLSLTGRLDDVISVFQQGLDSDLWWAEELFADSDLDAVRDLPEFKRLVAVSQERHQEAQAYIQREQAILLPEGATPGQYPLLIALHGRNGNKDSHLEPWQAARQRGWLVVSPQSTQALFPGAYCWDDPAQAAADMLFSYEDILQQYPIDPQRVILAGFSQGSGTALSMALNGNISAPGFIGVASWWRDPKSLVPRTEAARRLRGYFITGGQDHTLETAKEIQKVLKESDIQFEEESHPDLAHDFPADFEKSFAKAIDFIFKEQE